MNKKFIFVLQLLLFLSIYSFGQTLQNSVVGSTGASASAGTVKMDYTIGEIVVETFTAGGHTLTQGFHQTALHLVAIENADYFPEISMYPNPTSDLVNIDIPANYDKLDISLYDVTGKLIRIFSNAQGKVTIDAAVLATGTYYLQMINTAKNKVKTFKLIKN